MRKPAFRERLLHEHPAPPESPIAARLQSLDFMFPLGNPPEYEPDPSASIGASAAPTGRSALEVAYEYLIAGDGENLLFAPIANYAERNLDVCAKMLADKNTLLGLGDGGAHVSIISDASFSTYLLTHWGRDRLRGRFDVEWLVRRLTSDSARFIGLLDRGLIAPGMKADLNVIDFDALGLDVPYMVEDLPAGGRRLLQKAKGYRYTIVNGEATYRDGEPTGALPGRLVRGPKIAAPP